MPFAKKLNTEKMMRLTTTVKPEAYVRLKRRAENTGTPMSIILSDLILKHLPKDDFWRALIELYRQH